MAAVALLRPLSFAPRAQPSRAAVLRRAARSATAVSLVSPSPSPTKKVLVPIGYGTEEMEAVILVDVLRRAGADVLVASVETVLEVEASSGTRIVADASISECAERIFDLVALPGGMPGSARLRDCKILREITCKQAEAKRLYGGICAAPAVALQSWGLMKRKQMTGHPAFMDKLPTFWAVKSNLQVSGELTTSRGPGTSFEFALSFVEQLFGISAAEEIGRALLMNTSSGHAAKEEFNEVDWSFNNNPRVLVPVANGSEEIEVVVLVDILRRAKVDVVVASVEKTLQIVASRKTKVVADKFIQEASQSVYDLIVLPGGVTGAGRLHKCRTLKKLLKEQHLSGRMYGAMCSSPTILQKLGLLKDKTATAHPSVISELTGEVVAGSGIVIDGKLITSRGLGTAINFALTIVHKLFGHSRASSVAEGLALEYPRS